MKRKGNKIFLSIFLAYGLAVLTGCPSKKQSFSNQPPLKRFCIPNDPNPATCTPLNDQVDPNANAFQPRRFLLSLGFNQQYQLNASSEKFFREAMAICDRFDGLNIGTSDCDSWSSGQMNIYIDAQGGAASTQVGVTFEAAPRSGFWNSQGVFGIQNTFAVPQNPLYLPLSVAPVNDSKGFRIYGFGSNVTEAYNKRIDIEVTDGKLEDDEFFGRVMYDGQEIGSGRFLRN